MNIWDQEKYLQAWNFASDIHNGQKIPGSDIPYINHLGLVAMEATAAIASNEIKHPNILVLCALLHDSIEDSISRIKMQPKEVWMVKLCDRITNLQPPPKHWDKEKIAKYQNEARLILEQLGEANQLLADRLKRKIDAYDKYL